MAGTGAGSAVAAPSCGNNANGFEAWLGAFSRDAVAKGISPRVVDAALGNVSYDPEIVRADRRQGVFAQDFLTFAGRMVAKYRMQQGTALMRKYGDSFARIERSYGVPAAVITAFWGLETDFGANIGNLPTLRSLATLAWDCRRPELFREQLMAALRIVERGDLRPEEMVGPWAGEMGQTQFLPTHYNEYGVDFDGDGRRDLLRSAPDALASTANLLKAEGWRRGEPWLQEVRVPDRMPWDQADLDIRHPRAQWSNWGVRAADGSALPRDQMPASLLLPMGHNGPAFLAYANFAVYLEWNQSLVYATTAAYYATRLAGAPPVGPGRGQVKPLSLGETKELQQRLAARGFDVGKIDGIIGAQTRAAVKAVQLKLGLPADSYPDEDLLARLR
ncbi:MAG TPA: lytic murein transglycosylase [Hyphomicrobiales bacterium]|nr:lytic murein transglycosylase [Hyphomicrobiales bacterium]